MSDDQARELDKLLEPLPEIEIVRREVFLKSEDLGSERSDVSWISTESVDRDKEVVLASGMDDSHFLKNPVVTMRHDYESCPIGKCLWIKNFKDRTIKGIKAKTQYPEKPESWPEEIWQPDVAFSLIQAGLASGKSIGFITLESGKPTKEEIEKNPEWEKAKRIIRKWLLMEYAVTWLPANQDSIVQHIGKEFPKYQQPKAKEITKPKEKEVRPEPRIITLEAIQENIRNQFLNFNFKEFAKTIVQERLHTIKGKI